MDLLYASDVIGKTGGYMLKSSEEITMVFSTLSKSFFVSTFFLVCWFTTLAKDSRHTLGIFMELMAVKTTIYAAKKLRFFVFFAVHHLKMGVKPIEGATTLPCTGELCLFLHCLSSSDW